MKKILCLLLSLFVVFTSTMTISADGEVAQIGETKYDNLQAALTAAASATDEAKTIQLLSDVTENTSVSVENKNIILDLNGKELNGSLDVDTTGTLQFTLKDTSELKDGKITGNVSICGTGTLSLHETSPIKIIGNVTVDGSSTFECKSLVDGNISTTDNYSGTIKINNHATVTGTVIVNNGKVKVLSNSSTSKAHVNEIVLNGGTSEITGGVFNTDPSNLLNGTNYMAVINSSGVYDVIQKKFKFSIDDNYYETLSDAIQNVQSGEIIKMLANVDDATGISIPSGKNFTVDFCGHTYTINNPGAGSTNTKTQGFQFLNGSTIEFKNGTIKVAAANKDYTWTGDPRGIAWVMNNYANLTLTNMDVDGTNVAKNLKPQGLSDPGIIRYVINNYSGVFNMKGGSVIAADGDVAISANWYNAMNDQNSYPNKPQVNIEGTTITGKVEAISGTVNINNGTVVNGQVRVGENGRHSDKTNAGAKESTVTINNGATINNPTDYPAVVFGENTLIIEGEVNGCVATNGNAYNAGSVITVKAGANITNDGSGEEGGTAIYMPNGKLNIFGGTITGTTAVYFKSTNLNITGGTLIGNGKNKDYEYYGNGCKPTGDALVIDNCKYPSGLVVSNISISGGNFKSENAKSIGSYYGNEETESLKGFVKGGYFEKDIDEELIATGYKKSISDVLGYSKMVDDLNGSITVKEEKPKVENEVTGTDKTTIDIALGANKPTVEDLVDSIKTSDIDTIIEEAKDDVPALASATNIKVEIKAKVEAVEATISGASGEEEKTITFKVTPYAIVSDADTPANKTEVKVKNSYLSPNAKIKVTLPTCGITPKEVIHIRDNGSKEYFFSEGSKTFVDNGDTITIEISNFSEIKINAKVTYVAPKQNDHGKKKTYKAPSTGIE